MKKVTLLIFLIGFTITQFNFAQGDQPSGQTYQYDVPQNIKLLQQQIKLAEDNEDWATYNSLRPQLINALQVVNPQLASRYKNVSIELLNGDAPLVDVVTNSTNSNIVDQPMWATDVKVHNGNANDISSVSYTHLRAHETVLDLVCRLLLEKKKSPPPPPRFHVFLHPIVHSRS